MKLIKPSFEILTHRSVIEGMVKRIEAAGRTCYKSEERITEGSAEKFIAARLKDGHETIIEHESISVRIICDRGITHELVRHRLASFSQESTRYCNYSKDKFGGHLTFIIPLWLDLEEGPFDHHLMAKTYSPLEIWLYSMLNAESKYHDLLDQGWTPQQARSILPNSLKTEIVMTCNLREWRHIFRLRTSKAAHPQMREIMQPMLGEFAKLIPVLFKYISNDINLKKSW